MPSTPSEDRLDVVNVPPQDYSISNSVDDLEACLVGDIEDVSASSRGSKWACISDLPAILFDYVIARVLDIVDTDSQARRLRLARSADHTGHESEWYRTPNSTVLSLLCTSSRFHQASCMALYQEVHLPDDSRSFRRPSRRSRLRNVVKFPERYSYFVEHVTITPRPVPPAGYATDDEHSYFSYQPVIRLEYLGSGELIDFLSSLPRLRGIVWRSDRIPSSTFCQYLCQTVRSLRLLHLRPSNAQMDKAAPSREREGITSGSPLATLNREDVTGTVEGDESDGTSVSDQGDPHRWDALSIGLLHELRELHISHLSLEGNRQLTSGLETLQQLERVTLDYDFVDDAVLMALADHCNKLHDVRVRTHGTKLTERGVAALLEDSVALRSLTLSEVEGRLKRTLWSSLSTLPETFESLSIAFAEQSPHHSWISNHLASVFDILAVAHGQLRSYSVSRLIPIEALESPLTGPQRLFTNTLGLNLSESRPIGRVVPGIDDAVAPQPLPDGALMRLQEFGRGLMTLDIDYFTISERDFKTIIETCTRMQHLTVRLDAPLSKVLAMSSTFIRLTVLESLTLSITDTHIPKKSARKPSIATGAVSVIEIPSTPMRKSSMSSLRSTDDQSPELSMSRSTSSMPPPELSPASTTASLADADEAITPAHSPLTRRLVRPHSKSIGEASVDEMRSQTHATPTAPLAGLASQREIRKFSRRCPSLRVLRLAGRNGLGEWHISKHSIEWYGIGSLPNRTGRLDCETDFDISLARRRASAYSALSAERKGLAVLKDDVAAPAAEDAGDVSDAYTDDPFAPIMPPKVRSTRRNRALFSSPPRNPRGGRVAAHVTSPSPASRKVIKAVQHHMKEERPGEHLHHVVAKEEVVKENAPPPRPAEAQQVQQRLSSAPSNPPQKDQMGNKTDSHSRPFGRHDDAAKRKVTSSAKKPHRERGSYNASSRAHQAARAGASNNSRTTSPESSPTFRRRNLRLRRDYYPGEITSFAPAPKTSPTPSPPEIGPGPGGRIVPGFVPLDASEAGVSRQRRRQFSADFEDFSNDPAEDPLGKYRSILDKSMSPGFVRKLRTAPKNVGRGGAASGANSNKRK